MVKVKRVQSRKLKPPQAEKKFCAYLHRYCTRPRLDGYMYCMSHILEARNAPFKQCTFNHPKNRKRCTNAAPKNDKHESLCPWHAKQSKISELPPSVKQTEPESLVKLMSQLEHYCEDRKHNPMYDPDDEDFLEQFNNMNEIFESSFDILESGMLPGLKTRVNDARVGSSDVSESDTDYSDDDEPLKHAGVYTYEEVARIYRDKLIKLQTLYIEEMRHLQYLLSEKRRDYLRFVKNEKRTQGSISNTMPKTTQEEIEKYKMFRAMNRYHCVFGQEAILREKSLKRRLEVTGGQIPRNILPANEKYCALVDDENQPCGKKVLPLTKFCSDHILMDRHQVLFQHCPGGGNICSKVIVPFTDDARCLLHSCPEPPRQKKRSLSPVAGPSGLQNISDIHCQEQEHFQSMDDIASLGLDAVVPGSLFGLNQFGEPDDESTDSCATYESRIAGDYLYRGPEGYRDELLCEAHSDS